jgi:hypothetical protein
VQIQRQQLLLKELQMMATGVEAPPPQSFLGKLPLADWAYRRMYTLYQTPAAAAKATEASIKKAQEALAEAQQRPLTPVTDGCVVVFNYAEHAMNAYRDLSQSHWEEVKGLCSKPKGPLLEDVGHRHSAGHDYPEAPNAGASGGTVVAEHAPEPSDFWCASCILSCAAVLCCRTCTYHRV